MSDIAARELVIEIVLSIPDNEARTALATLQRLAVDAHALERADLYRFELESAQPDRAELLATLRTLESIYNPNKHVLRVRESARPLAGEVWIDERSEVSAPRAGHARLGGRILAGVRDVARFTAWHIRDAAGGPADASVVSAATETLLCNPAFQRAIR